MPRLSFSPQRPQLPRLPHLPGTVQGAGSLASLSSCGYCGACWALTAPASSQDTPTAVATARRAFVRFISCSSLAMSLMSARRPPLSEPQRPLSVQPDVFHPPTVIDAVDHQRVALCVGTPARPGGSPTGASSRERLIVEPEVFEARAVVDAVDHQGQPLHPRLPAGGLTGIEDDRANAVLD